MFENLNPLDKSTAILEIVIMLVVAFLIGFFTSWFSRKKKDGVQMGKEQNESGEQVENANAKIDELSANLSTLHEDNENLKNQIIEYEKNVQTKEASVNSISELEARIVQLQNEKMELTDELHEQEKLNYELKHKLKRPAPKFSSKEAAAEALGFKLAREEDKEDLTIIKGVGPFIQEKLNELGIYTVEQISDFTINTVIKVTEAIEYFPGRIQRDFWVEQANQILNDRSAES